MPHPESLLFHSVEIIDSIPENESQTAIHLREDLLDLCTPEQSWTVKYDKCGTRSDFFERLEIVADDANKSQRIPILHIECHGSGEGIKLTDKTVVPWAQLVSPLCSLNYATSA